MLRSSSLLLAMILSLGLSMVSGTQAFGQDTPDVAMGMSPQATYHSGDFDFVDMSTGRLNLHIPLVTDHSQRGNLNFTYSLKYTSTGAWNQVSKPPHGFFFIEPPKYGVSSPAIVNDSSLSGMTSQVYHDSSDGYFAEAWSVFEGGWGIGRQHPLGTISGGGAMSGVWESIDGSGISATIYLNCQGDAYRTTNRYGIQFLDNTSGTCTLPHTAWIEDSNGNQTGLGADNSFPTSTTTDTLGRTWTTTQSSSNVSGCPTGGPVAPNSSVIWTIPGPVNVGGVRTFKFCYSSYNVHTGFNIQYTQDYTLNGVGLLTGIVLPDGTTWRFDYDSSSTSYGDLLAVYPPTGGHISYTWQTTGGAGGCGASATYDVGVRTIATRTIYDGTSSNTWTYTAGNPIYTVTDPLGNDTVYTNLITTTTGDSSNCVVSGIQYYSGTGNSRTLVKTVAKGYLSLADPYPDDLDSNESGCITSCLIPTLLQSVSTTWSNGQQSQELLTYDSGFTFTDQSGGFNQGTQYASSYGLVLSDSHSDYANGAPGPVLSTTKTNYVALTNSNYITANILDLPSSAIVTDGSPTPNICAETDYGYDEYIADPSGITKQHVSPPNSVQGNLTSITRQLFINPCSSPTPSKTPLKTTYHVYDTGLRHTVTDPLNNPPTTSTYSGTYYGAYPTSVCNALNQCTTYGYDFNAGLMTSMTDPNNQGTTWTWDCMMLPKQANYPDGGQDTVTFSYNPSSGGCGTGVTSTFASATLTKKISPSLNKVTTQIFDGLGRQKETQLNTDSGGTDYTDIAYDPDGRVYKVWNPTRCSTANYPNQTNCGESTWGVTTTYYDPLNRPCLVVPQDGTLPSSYSCPTTSPGNDVQTQYSGNCTTVTDQTGKQRESCADGLGRLTGILEDPNGLKYQTTYGYDANNDLVSVVQSGSRQRNFTYDSLSRLNQATNPESGTVSYSHDANGNVLTKTDARGLTIKYSPSDLPIDALNRVRKKTYSNGDPSVTYTYDGSGCLGQAACYNIGRRTGMTDAAGSEAWSYDKMGRVVVNQRTTNGVTKAVTYSSSAAPYNFDGSIAQLVYPSVRIITYTPNSAGQTISAVDTANNVNYATLAMHAPNGSLISLMNGANILATWYYNNRLQPCRIAVNSSGTAPNACGDSSHSGNVLDFTYSFNSGTADNGNVMGIVNNRDNTRSQTFGYDVLNRLVTAQTAATYATSPSHCWGESYQYDNQPSGGPWGNLTNINGASSAYNGCSQESLSVTVNANNHLLNSSNQDTYYDAAGNMTALPSGLTVSFNAEEQITNVNGSTYLYDGDGRRVAKSAGGTVYKIYWYGLNDAPLAESDGGGNITDEFIFFNGKRIAHRVGP